jgi:hypothetical protein
MMNLIGLRPLYRNAAIFYYRWALNEIHPLHQDIPYIVHRLNALEREL